MIMFALSLDLILGYAGIVTLGHAAFFGVGAYTVALASLRLGWSEPISGIVVGGIVAGLAGAVVAWFILRYRGLTLLMLTIAFAAMLQESGNLRSDITGGYGGGDDDGAEFITRRIPKYGEIRCYIRDPDGYIIEVGQSTDLTYG